MMNNTYSNIPGNHTSISSNDDGEGAMYFIVSTVIVYGLGIVAFIASHIYRRNKWTAVDEETNFCLRRWRNTQIDMSLVAVFKTRNMLQKIQSTHIPTDETNNSTSIISENTYPHSRTSEGDNGVSDIVDSTVDASTIVYSSDQNNTDNIVHVFKESRLI